MGSVKQPPHPSSQTGCVHKAYLSVQCWWRRRLERSVSLPHHHFLLVLRDTSQTHQYKMTLKALDTGLELTLLSGRGIFLLCTTFSLSCWEISLVPSQKWLCELLKCWSSPSHHPSGRSMLVERQTDKDHDLWGKAKHQSGAETPNTNKPLKFSPSHNYLHKFWFAGWTQNLALPCFVMCKDLEHF